MMSIFFQMTRKKPSSSIDKKSTGFGRKDSIDVLTSTKFVFVNIFQEEDKTSKAYHNLVFFEKKYLKVCLISNVKKVYSNESRRQSFWCTKNRINVLFLSRVMKMNCMDQQHNSPF